MVSTSDIAPPLGERYRLVEHLAEGAITRVYRCFDTDTDTFAVAKVLTSHKATARIEFADVGTRLKAIEHRSLVKVLDAGIDGDRAFHILEPVDGNTVGARLAMYGPLPAQMAARTVNAMLDVLHLVHDADMLHGGLHPSSILADQTKGVKITGMGLATVHSVLKTQHDPAYQAPEIRGGGELDRRSEVYAAGAVFYHLLTDGDPSRLHLAGPDDNMFSLMPAAFEQVILGACGLHPADRFPDARQFRAALTAAAARLPSDPVGAQPLALEDDDESTLVPFDTDAFVAEVTGNFDMAEVEAAVDALGLHDRVKRSWGEVPKKTPSTRKSREQARLGDKPDPNGVEPGHSDGASSSNEVAGPTAARPEMPNMAKPPPPSPPDDRSAGTSPAPAPAPQGLAPMTMPTAKPNDLAWMDEETVLQTPGQKAHEYDEDEDDDDAVTANTEEGALAYAEELPRTPATTSEMSPAAKAAAAGAAGAIAVPLLFGAVTFMMLIVVGILYMAIF